MEALVRDEALLRAVGDVARLNDRDYRHDLACRVESLLRSVIAGMPDATDRRVAEILLGASPDCRGKTVGRARGEAGLSSYLYQNRRTKVLGIFEHALSESFFGTTVFVAGNYADGRYRELCERLGRMLAALPVKLVSGCGAAGLDVCQGMWESLPDDQRMRPDKILTYARVAAEPTRVTRRIGTVRHVGRTQEEKRKHMLPGCDLTLVIAGGGGTAAEAWMARKLGMPVIPLAHTGGAAQLCWHVERESLSTFRLGGRPVNAGVYDRLAAPGADEALAAAVDLIRQCVSLPPVTN